MATAHAPWDPNKAPLVKAHDVVYVRFSVPDLAQMKTFIETFGLQVAHLDDDTIYSRGLGENPFVHVVHRGPPKFIGWAFKVNREADLHVLAKHQPGCSAVHDIPGKEGELGGGKRVHFVKSGFLIEVVHGQWTAPLQSARVRAQYNHGGVHERLGRLQDVGNRATGGGKVGVPEIRRLGHVVLSIPLNELKAWAIFLHDTFGLVGSDSNMAGPGKLMSIFMQMDRGA